MQCEQHFRRSWFAVPPWRRALSLRRQGTTRSASRAAISALAAAIAVFRATSSARRRRPGDWLIAMPIPISEPTPNCSLTAAANPEGDSDAHAGFGGFCNRDGVRGWPSNGPNVRPRLSRLPARVWTRHLLRMSLYIVTSVQCVGIGPPGTMRAQSICRERGRVDGTILPAAPPSLLIYSERNLVTRHVWGAGEASEPAIHNHDRGVWIPDLRQEAHPQMCNCTSGMTHLSPS
jgi:hypothetical protein